MPENEHEGHRQRLKKQFSESGLEHFAPHVVLELLLFYVIPRKDTNVVAHRLMKRFGSLSGVFDARAEDLAEVEGMGIESARYLKLFPQVARRYLEDKVDAEGVFEGTTAVGKYLISRYVGMTDEVVMLVSLDNKDKMISCTKVCEGDITSAQVPPRKVVEEAVAMKAAKVIIAHNHPKGLLVPSGEDLAFTRSMAKLLRQIGVRLVDHLIIGDDDYVSIAASGFDFFF